MEKKAATNTLRSKMACLRLFIGSLIWFGLGSWILQKNGLYATPDWMVISALETPVEFYIVVSIPFIVGVYLLLEVANRMFFKKVQKSAPAKTKWVTTQIVRIELMIGSVVWFCSGFLLIKLGGIQFAGLEILSKQETPIHFWFIASIIFMVGFYLTHKMLKLRKQESAKSENASSS
jgi:hypothetical protein